MSLETFLLLANIQTTLSAVVAILCLYKFKSREIHIRLIGFSFLIAFIANVATVAMAKLQWREFHNTPTIFYVISNFFLLTAAYYHLLGRKKKMVFILIAVVFLITAVLNSYLYQKSSLNSYSYVFQAIVIIVYTILYFYKLIADLPEQYIHRLPMFWINSSFLIFYSGTFILFTFTSYLTHVVKDNMITYWSFHNMLSILEHLIIFVGLYYDISRLKKPPF